MKNKYSFKSNGSEGMLDVILSCLLMFMLMSALVRIDQGNGSTQEKTLQAMDLSSAKMNGEGEAETGRLTLSLKKEGETLVCYVEDEPFTLAQLPERLKQLQGVSYVALRRDADMNCGVEDLVILACRKAGIDQVAIVIKEVE